MCADAGSVLCAGQAGRHRGGAGRAVVRRDNGARAARAAAHPQRPGRLPCVTLASSMLGWFATLCSASPACLMRELCSALQPAGALVNRQAHHACALLARPQGRACGPAGSRAARLGTRLQPAPSRAHECTSARGQGRPRPSPNPGPRRRRSRATRATRPATPPRSAPRSTACWAATSATSTWSARAWRRTGACTGRRAAWPPRCSRRPCSTPSCCWSTWTRRTSWRAPQG